AMANFFEKLQAEVGKSGRGAEFFSDHPNPENRIGGVNNEIVKLGGAPPNARNDSTQFQEIKRIVSSYPAPRGTKPGTRGNSGGGGSSKTGRPSRPTNRLVDFQTGDIRLRHPDNWREYGQGNAVTLAPDGGIVSNSLAYGMMIATYEPHDDTGVGRVS